MTDMASVKEWVTRPPFQALAHAMELQAATFKRMREWQEANEVGAELGIAPDRRSVLVFANMKVSPPILSWQSQLSDVLHNYRVVLDRIAWDLATTHFTSALTEREKKNVYFPLFLTAADLEKAVAAKSGWLTKLDPVMLERLVETQPFTAHDPDQSILRWLSELDNDGKHRDGISMRGVYDTMFPIYLHLFDENGAVIDPITHRSEWLAEGATVVDRLAIIRVHSTVAVTSTWSAIVPLTMLVRRGDYEIDMEYCVWAVQVQVIGTLVAIYGGFWPPPEAILAGDNDDTAWSEQRKLLDEIWGEIPAGFLMQPSSPSWRLTRRKTRS